MSADQSRDQTLWRARIIVMICGASLLASSQSVRAAEQISYSYDALGRLSKVVVNSGPKAGSQTTYILDPAGNRTSVSVTGSGKPVVVVPVNGLTVIPLLVD